MAANRPGPYAPHLTMEHIKDVIPKALAQLLRSTTKHAKEQGHPNKPKGATNK